MLSLKNPSAYFRWSTEKNTIPEKINEQLVGTFPCIVIDNDRRKICAFFVRASDGDHLSLSSGKRTGSYVKPQFVKTPQGPLLVAYCATSRNKDPSKEPFISETAIFPRLDSMPSHREMAGLLASTKYAFYVICNEKGECILNSRAKILNSWRKDFAEKSKAFDEGKQITDEKTAILSLYWYQDRYNPTAKIFEVRASK